AKVEHVLDHDELWPELAAAGCLFVVSAFESTSDEVLAILDKGHDAQDEADAVRVLRAAGIEPRPSLLPFTPWTTADDMAALLDLVARCDLVGNVDAVQYAIRLLVPPGSLLLDSGHLDGRLGTYDTERLGWQWRSPDPRLDELHVALTELAERAADWGAQEVYDAVRAATWDLLDADPSRRDAPAVDESMRSTIPVGERPRLSESWFCCAEPTDTQLLGAGLASVGNGGR
ncbi:MAG: CUAEP/CCAEP-tail radical SAM (seleno)protein, partial [Acidimicrobiales bacterium]